MATKEEKFRFWTPVVLLALMALYATWGIVKAHTDSSIELPPRKYKQTLPGLRGGIYSSCGKTYPFVRSVPYWDYRLDPKVMAEAKIYPPKETNGVAAVKKRMGFFESIKKRFEPKSAKARAKTPPRTPAALLKTVSDLLHVDYADLKKMYQDRRKGWREQLIASSTDEAAYRILSNPRMMGGIRIDGRQKREYFRGPQLIHVLGVVQGTNVGGSGLEQRYNSILTGTDGIIEGKRDVSGHELHDKRTTDVAPVPGRNLYLTIDHNLQADMEESLKWGIAEFDAGAAWGIIMEANTGKILAMASFPNYDPKDLKSMPTNSTAFLNRAIGYNYEPGSVMKTLTVAAGIDCGYVGPGTIYRTNRDDPRYYRLPGDGSHSWPATMTVREALVHSSNIVIGKLAYDLGPARLWTYLTQFGIGKRTGIDLPGEEKGQFPHYKQWDKATWSRAGIGQGVSVTAIQIISAYQAIANDGVRMKPYVVDRIVSSGGEVRHISPHRLDAPIKPSTARTLRSMMLGVTSKTGTARRAAIPGYTVAGKTGTAQKVLPGTRGYAPGLYRATFCGIVPATAPRLVILISLDFNSKTTFHQGGNSSGPVFRRVAMLALRYLMVPPDISEDVESGEVDEAYQRILAEREAKNGNT